MKVAFIRPNMHPGRSHDAMEPLVFAILAGVTPPDVERVLYDERIEAIDYDDPTDLAAITVETYTARRAYEIALEYRKRGVPVVMGGYHPTFLPEEALLYADAVAVGDAEDLWPQILRDAGRGRLQPVYARERQPSLAGRVVDRSIFEGKRYASIRPVQYGRGCRFACDFCSIHAFYGKNLRQRPLREFVAEVETFADRPLFLVDDNLFVNVDQAEALFRALKPLGAKWVCQISMDVAANETLLDLMAEAGCVTALIGFESLNPNNLRQMGKRWNLKQGAYEGVIERFRQRGMMLYGTFVFGYDQDTPASFDVTVDWALRQKFCLANFNPLTPTPGARLYDRMRAEGRLLFDRWWLDPRFRYGDATFTPRGMTADELTRGCFEARRRFNTASGILRRAFEPRTNCRNPRNLGLFLMANLVSRREILRKQGMSLGSDRPLPARPGALSTPLYRRRHAVHADLS